MKSKKIKKKIISVGDAQRLGLDRYFTGIPCKYGHLSEREIGGKCIECKTMKKNESKFFRKMMKGEIYYEGEPCKHGHGRTRYVAGDICVICTKNRSMVDHRDINQKIEYKINENIYYRGKDCIRKHGGIRYVSTKMCVECMKMHQEDARKRRLVCK